MAAGTSQIQAAEALNVAAGISGSGADRNPSLPPFEGRKLYKSVVPSLEGCPPSELECRGVPGSDAISNSYSVDIALLSSAALKAVNPYIKTV
jgi:hypothetical protein